MGYRSKLLNIIFNDKDYNSHQKEIISWYNTMDELLISLENDTQSMLTAAEEDIRSKETEYTPAIYRQKYGAGMAAANTYQITMRDALAAAQTQNLAITLNRLTNQTLGYNLSQDVAIALRRLKLAMENRGWRLYDPGYIAIARPEGIELNTKNKLNFYATVSSDAFADTMRPADSVKMIYVTEDELWNEVLHLQKLSEDSFADNPDVNYHDGARNYISPIMIFKITTEEEGKVTFTQTTYKAEQISMIQYIMDSTLVEIGCYPGNNTRTEFKPDITISGDPADTKIIYAKTGEPTTDTIRVPNGYGIEQIKLTSYSDTSVEEVDCSFEHQYGSEFYKITYTPTTSRMTIKLVLVRRIENFIDWERRAYVLTLGNETFSTIFIPIRKDCITFDAIDSDLMHAYSGDYDADKDTFNWTRIKTLDANLKDADTNEPSLAIKVDRLVNQSLLVNYFMVRFVEGALFVNNTRIQSQYDECALAITTDKYSYTWYYLQSGFELYHLSNLPKISNIMVSTSGSSYVKLFGADANPNQIVYDSAEDALLNGTMRWDRRSMPSILLPYNEAGMYTKSARKRHDESLYESYVQPVNSPTWSFSDNVTLSVYRTTMYTNGDAVAPQASEDESLSIAYVDYELRGIRVYINKTPEELKGWRYIRVIVKDSAFTITSESTTRYNCYQILVIDRSTGKIVQNNYPTNAPSDIQISSIDLNGSDFKAVFNVTGPGVLKCNLIVYNRDDYAFLFTRLTARNFMVLLNDGSAPAITSMKYNGLFLGHKFNNSQTNTLPTETYIASFTIEYRDDFTCQSPVNVLMTIPDAKTAFVCNVKTGELKALNMQTVAFKKGV